MAAVTPAPFAIALIATVPMFGALTWWLVQESRRPVAFPERHVSKPHVSHTRIAAISVLFIMWSLWVTTRPVNGWR
jgi:hypothetical protein